MAKLCITNYVNYQVIDFLLSDKKKAEDETWNRIKGPQVFRQRDIIGAITYVRRSLLCYNFFFITLVPKSEKIDHLSANLAGNPT